MPAGQESAASAAQSAATNTPDTELGNNIDTLQPDVDVGKNYASIGSDSKLVPASSADEPAAETPSMAKRVAGAVVAGLMFGYALNKGAVYRADVIINQFSFTDNTMLLVRRRSSTIS